MLKFTSVSGSAPGITVMGTTRMAITIRTDITHLIIDLITVHIIGTVGIVITATIIPTITADRV
jgi:hypothetical protein